MSEFPRVYEAASVVDDLAHLSDQEIIDDLAHPYSDAEGDILHAELLRRGVWIQWTPEGRVQSWGYN
jgi:hypothetical protein